MYDMIRDYARDTLTEEGLAQRLRERHLDHFADKAEVIGANALGKEMRPYLLQLLSDASNHRAALGWALESGDLDRAAQMIYALHWVWISQATFTEALSWIDKAAAKLQGAPDSRAAALIHEAACSVRMAAGDYVGGLPHGTEAKRLYSALADADGVARIELTRSICATVSGEMEDPSEILMGSIAHFRDRDASTAALGMILLGEGARMAGALDAAEGCYAEALEIFAAEGNVFWPSHLKQNIAHFRLKEGRWQEAAELLAEAFDLAEDYNFIMVSNLGRVRAERCRAAIRRRPAGSDDPGRRRRAPDQDRQRTGADRQGRHPELHRRRPRRAWRNRLCRRCRRGRGDGLGTTQDACARHRRPGRHRRLSPPRSS